MSEILVFFPVRRCEVRACRAAYVGIDARCAPCDRKQGNPAHATKRDVVEHKRASVRKRLGLPA